MASNISFPCLHCLSSPSPRFNTSIFGSTFPRSSVQVFLASASFAVPRSNYVVALFGGNGTSGKEKKKFITRKEEPEQYWQTEAEKEGRGPMLTPIPYIIIFGFLTPFIILGIAFVNGWIKVPVR